MTIELIQVDAFADRAFSGNPAAVCILDEPRDDVWMQLVAREMNLSETAFLVQRGDRVFDLRWFTPVHEVDLCGHATLASAHVIWERSLAETDAPICFDTRSGRLTCIRREGVIEMNFPAHPPLPCEPPDNLLEALGGNAVTVLKNRMDYLVEFSSEHEVRTLAPNFTMLANVEARGTSVTARADASASYDFVSRFFAPKHDINEDPVTGSAHCCLAPFWVDRLGKSELLGYQCSKRGGFVRVGLNGDRVTLGGTAVTVMRAELLESAMLCRND